MSDLAHLAHMVNDAPRWKLQPIMDPAATSWGLLDQLEVACTFIHAYGTGWGVSRGGYRLARALPPFSTESVPSRPGLR